MKNLKIIILSTIISITMSCGNGGSKKDESGSKKTEISSNQEDYVEVILVEYVCGDNCYLEYFENIPNSSKKMAICLADKCGNWETSRKYPLDLKNRIALVKFTTTKQYDVSGNVMNENFPAVTDIKITNQKAKISFSDEQNTVTANLITGSILLGYIQKLQGTWKRQSYPFGTIEFKENRVKFNEGEGASELPDFKPFELLNNCDAFGTDIPEKMYDFGLLTDKENCTAIKLNGTTLKIYIDKGNASIMYKKITTDAKDNSEQNNQGFDDFSGRVLPLEPGFYVLKNSDCENPANAVWRYWNGMGLSGSSTKSCKMEVRKIEGNKFKVSQSCKNTYDSSKSTTELTLIISDVNHFSITQNGKNQEFEFCEKTPSWLKM